MCYCGRLEPLVLGVLVLQSLENHSVCTLLWLQERGRGRKGQGWGACVPTPIGGLASPHSYHTCACVLTLDNSLPQKLLPYFAPHTLQKSRRRPLGSRTMTLMRLRALLNSSVLRTCQEGAGQHSTGVQGVGHRAQAYADARVLVRTAELQRVENLPGRYTTTQYRDSECGRSGACK